MKVIISHNLNTHPRNAMRQCGYWENYDRRSGKTSFIRRLSTGHYPRFHCYVKTVGENLIFDLHIDQKQASYAGLGKHSGEYDSEVVLKEGERINQILSGFVTKGSDTSKNEPISTPAEEGKEKKGGVFNKLFG